VSTIDLNNLPDHRVSIMPAESPLEQKVRLIKDVVRFAFAMIMVFAILAICLATIFGYPDLSVGTGLLERPSLTSVNRIPLLLRPLAVLVCKQDFTVEPA